jgi:hypothetical protein
MRRRTKESLFFLVLLILLIVTLVFLVKAEATATTVYATVNRTVFIAWITPTANVCARPFDLDMDTGHILVHIGDETQYFSEEEETWWFQYIGLESFAYSDLTGTLDSARVVIPVMQSSVACTGDPYINIYTGDCAIAGGCTGAATFADTANCTTLRRSYKVSQLAVVFNLSMRVDSCITIGGTHTLDMRFEVADRSLTALCACVTDKDNEITFAGPSAADPYKPYLVIYTHAGSSPPATTAIQYFPDEEEQ